MRTKPSKLYGSFTCSSLLATRVAPRRVASHFQDQTFQSIDDGYVVVVMVQADVWILFFEVRSVGDHSGMIAFADAALPSSGARPDGMGWVDGWVDGWMDGWTVPLRKLEQ
ncbi:hypothetical protein ACN47E_003720 [Coniothyrium glycines]